MLKTRRTSPVTSTFFQYRIYQTLYAKSIENLRKFREPRHCFSNLSVIGVDWNACSHGKCRSPEERLGTQGASHLSWAMSDTERKARLARNVPNPWGSIWETRHNAGRFRGILVQMIETHPQLFFDVICSNLQKQQASLEEATATSEQNPSLL